MYSKPVSIIVNFIFGICLFFSVCFVVLLCDGTFAATTQDVIVEIIFNVIWMSLCGTYNKWLYEERNIQEYEKKEFFLSVLIPLVCPVILIFAGILLYV